MSQAVFCILQEFSFRNVSYTLLYLLGSTPVRSSVDKEVGRLLDLGIQPKEMAQI